MDREFFYRFFDFFGPGPSKNASEKMPLRSFCREFRAESSHGEPDRARDNFQKKCYYFFKKLDFNILFINQSFIRPPSLEPRRKMTANGLSSYDLIPVRGFHDWLISAQVRVGTGSRGFRGFSAFRRLHKGPWARGPLGPKSQKCKLQKGLPP